MPVFGTSPTDVGTVFDIYSIGDGLFMRRVIDSVAAMSNTGLLIDLFGFSLILGLLIMAFRNVMAGGTKLELGTMLVSVILGFAMFGMKTTVNIHDMNFAPGEVDQPVYVVANVPYGIAAAGWLVSNVGYTLTQKMETAYGLGGGQTTLIEGGFGNTLEWINSIRLWGVAGFNDPANNLGTFRQNLSDYMISCVRPAIEMGHLKLDHLLTTSNIWTWGTADGQGGIGYKSQYLTAHYDDRNPATTDDMITCEDAFNRLNTDRTAMPAAFADAYATSRLDTSTAGKDAQTAMANAFSTIGINGAKMQDLIVAEATGLTLELAIEGQQVSQALNAQSKMMIEQASIQRATQWSAEETMFRRIMRPMMAFFESLMYAVAPFMALMLGLGTYGMQAIGKYLMFSIWVSLWMPVLSIIELFQVTMMQHAVDAMNLGLDHTASGDAAGITMAKTEQLRAMAIDWLGTGAAMAAFTPAITMALVWGGAMTATALAGQMRGGDTVDEKMVAPDASRVGSAVTTMSASDFDRSHGAVQSGGLSTLPSIDIGSEASTNITAGQRRVEGAQENAARTIATAFKDAVEQARSRSSDQGTGNTGAIERADTSGVRVDHTDGVTFRHGADNNTAVNQGFNSSWMRSLAAQFGIGGSGGLPGANAGATGALTDTTGSSTTQSSGRGVLLSNGTVVDRATGYMVQDKNTMDEFRRMSSSQRDAVMRSVASSRDVQRAVSAYQSAERSYSEASAVSQQYGAHASFDAAYLGREAMKNGGAQAAAAIQAVHSLGGRAEEAMARYYRQFGAIQGGQERDAAAAIFALYQTAHEGTRFGASEEQAQFARDSFMASVDKRGGDDAFFGGGSRPEQMANIAPRAPSSDDVNRLVDSELRDTSVNGSLRGQVNVAPVGAHPENYAGVGSADAIAGDTLNNIAATAGASVHQAGTNAIVEETRGMGGAASTKNGYRFEGWEKAAGEVTHAALVDSRQGNLTPGYADANHPLSRRMAALSNATGVTGFLNDQQIHLLAVVEQLRQGGPRSVPEGDVQDAYKYMGTTEGQTVLMAYGDRQAGRAHLTEDAALNDAGRRDETRYRTAYNLALEQEHERSGAPGTTSGSGDRGRAGNANNGAENGGGR